MKIKIQVQYKDKNKACSCKHFLFSVQRLSETFFILRRAERDRSKIDIGLNIKYRYFYHVLMKLEIFIDRFSKNTQISNLKHLEIFEMWCWRRMEKISWTDHVINEEVLHRVKEQWNILHEIS
jgi:hypothetical protein